MRTRQNPDLRMPPRSAIPTLRRSMPSPKSRPSAPWLLTKNRLKQPSTEGSGTFRLKGARPAPMGRTQVHSFQEHAERCITFLGRHTHTQVVDMNLWAHFRRLLAYLAPDRSIARKQVAVIT